MARQLLATAVALVCASPAWGAADADRGRVLYETRCGACHAIAENGPGPRHLGVWGCRAGTQPGYDYSPALAASGLIWSDATLDRWLQDPNALVPGNKMAVRLADKAADRADLIAYLKAAGGNAHDCRRP